ncbi:MAG: phosphate signaling complex protein PhoU [Mariprofundus sp.]|nr:phosphate signaling complex protein PhoU [Mariprofundus sp.]
MKDHTVRRFEDELNELKATVLSMGGMVEKAVRRSMKALLEHDPKRARKVIERDDKINQLERDIDQMTRNILALRQPAASDLRFIISTIKIVTDLERTGDMAEGIAEAMLKSQETPLTHLESLEELALKATAQLKKALDCFARGDVLLALSIIENEKSINGMFQRIQRENLTYMLEDHRKISAGLMAYSIGKNLERIGDHAVNIAEMVIYMVQGHDVRHIDHETASALVTSNIES